MTLAVVGAVLVALIPTAAGLHRRSGKEESGCSDPPCTITFHERTNPASCSFLKEDGKPADCLLEVPVHKLVQKFVKPGSTVLELGSRYGTTTCEIARAQGNSQKLVTVEPDSSVWGALEGNMASHGCKHHLLKGVIGTKNMYRDDAGYALSVSSTGVGKQVVATPLSNVSAQFGLQFDTLVIDCEGCLPKFLKENSDMLGHVHTIIFEADSGTWEGSSNCFESYDKCVDYNSVVAGLERTGFKLKKDIALTHLKVGLLGKLGMMTPEMKAASSIKLPSSAWGGDKLAWHYLALQRHQ